jgi:hypothetical protein
MMMLASQIASIQNDIISITNVSSSISSAGKAQAALNENSKVAKTALTERGPTAPVTSEASAQASAPQSKPIRLDMTGAFVDTVA